MVRIISYRCVRRYTCLIIAFIVPLTVFIQHLRMTTAFEKHSSSISEMKKRLLLRDIYQERARQLSERCKHSATSVRHRQSPLDSEVFLTLRSHSLMYCAVAKVATTSLRPILIYFHLQEIYNHITGDRIQEDFIGKTPEELVNVTSLIQTLEENAISISHSNEQYSVSQVLQAYLRLFYLTGTTGEDLPVKINVWKFGLEDHFPYLRMKSLSNSSDVFGPSFVRMIFVRHPFERLASAYSEKIATLPEDRRQEKPHYDQIRQKICEEYVTLNTSYSSTTNSSFYEKCIPAFEHFVKYILDEYATSFTSDPHWRPYSTICTVCQYKYNFIGKLETMETDYSELLRYLNIPDWDIQKRRNPSQKSQKSYQQFFSSLSDELFCRLKEFYANDFHLFSYRPDDYIDRSRLNCQDIIRQ